MKVLRMLAGAASGGSSFHSLMVRGRNQLFFNLLDLHPDVHYDYNMLTRPNLGYSVSGQGGALIF